MVCGDPHHYFLSVGTHTISAPYGAHIKGSNPIVILVLALALNWLSNKSQNLAAIRRMIFIRAFEIWCSLNGSLNRLNWALEAHKTQWVIKRSSSRQKIVNLTTLDVCSLVHWGDLLVFNFLSFLIISVLVIDSRPIGGFRTAFWQIFGGDH